MPYIDGSQAQKHITHNEALRILDSAIQIGVLDLTLTAPPSSPGDGERHVVAGGATGAWAGHNNAIATWQDGAWAFLAPKIGWCIWSVADDVMFAFDGTVWRDFRSLPAALDNALRVGVNTAASSPNLFSVKSNAALFAAIDAADGGTGDMRLQVSKETSADTASVFFSDNFSGRAEFGLVGSDTFKLKVSPDGSAWTDAFNIDQGSGNLTLPRGLALTGVIAPAQITTNQNDYNPAGIAAASVLQINTDAARSISGLAGGAEGRCVTIINVGSQPLTLLNESTSSSASNRFTLSGSLTIAAKQAAILRYDGTAARWQAMAGSAALVPGNNLSDLNSAATALTNLGGTTVGVSVFKATDAAAAQAVIGLPNGISIQTASASSSTFASGTTTFAFGDNVPTITEGTEIITCAITPKYSTSKLRIDYNIRIAGTGGNTVGVALFQDATSAAIDGEQLSIVNADNGTTLCGVYFMTAGTTSSTTFRLRAGCAGGTWYVNGTSAGRRFGGVLTTTLSVTEIKG